MKRYKLGEEQPLRDEQDIFWRYHSTFLIIAFALVVAFNISLIFLIIAMVVGSALLAGNEWILFIIVIASGIAYAIIAYNSAKVGKLRARTWIKIYVGFHALYLAITIIAALLALSS